MLWGMGQMGPVLVSVSFTLNSVTKLNSVNPRARAEHLDTVLRASGTVTGTTATATAAIAVAFSVGDIFTHRVRSHVSPPLTADA